MGNEAENDWTYAQLDQWGKERTMPDSLRDALELASDAITEVESEELRLELKARLAALRDALEPQEETE